MFRARTRAPFPGSNENEAMLNFLFTILTAPEILKFASRRADEGLRNRDPQPHTFHLGNHRTVRNRCIRSGRRFNDPDKALEFIILLYELFIFQKLEFSCIQMNRARKKKRKKKKNQRSRKNLSPSARRSYLIPQTLCRGSPRSR